MTIAWREQLRPGFVLREIVQQATEALIAMDANRLDELARCCADLNRGLEDTENIADAAKSLREADSELKILGRVLIETRANLTVLSRLHALRIGENGISQRRRTVGKLGLCDVTAYVMNRTERASGNGDN